MPLLGARLQSRDTWFVPQSGKAVCNRALALPTSFQRCSSRNCGDAAVICSGATLIDFRLSTTHCSGAESNGLPCSINTD